MDSQPGSWQSRLLLAALFATGVSGIVAEYLLSTLATYFLGNSLVQWTLIISFMLFAMGLGSRLSRYIVRDHLRAFIRTEFALSLLVSASTAAAFLAQPFPVLDVLSIYLPALTIGLLIGLEIPLALQINRGFATLRVNVSTVLEKDYWGSLVGGVLFAFVALPFLGMTWTPVVFGLLNFLVAGLLLLFHRGRELRWLRWGAAGVLAWFLVLALTIKPLVIFGDQLKYRDRIVLEKQTRYQRLVVTRWKNHYWFFINGNTQFSTFDEQLYHEPLVHPVLGAASSRSRVLILGGGDGLAAREVLKYPQVREVTLVDLDAEVTRLARENPIFTGINGNSLADPRLQVINTDAFTFLDSTRESWPVIIADFPDPNSVDLARLYSVEFYTLCRYHLAPGGALVTQATSPLFSPEAFRCIGRTLAEAGFRVFPFHNYVPSLGDWGWYLALRQPLSRDSLLTLLAHRASAVPTRWYSPDAVQQLFHFGRPAPRAGVFQVEVNTLLAPVVLDYYRRGDWGVAE